jgi:hypothetical protein
MLKRILVLIAIALVAGSSAFAQVTTSSMSGTVKAANGEPLVGASITATHTPSGTQYGTISKKDGVFNLPGLRIGGPYTVKIDFVGQQSAVFNDITLQLGEDYNIQATLGQDQRELSGVVVTGRGRKAASDKGGMSTVLNNRVLSGLPTISRSITDFTRLTPQANGTNFGGRDARFNNITVDGANLNNNFALSNDPIPGGGNNPVSLDAIDEVSVSIAPFDVRQGNFTGANIAATTKSGTNVFHGTAYTYWQNEKLIGDNVRGIKALNPPQQTKIYGGSVGGPIIKNKLFFFINGEYEQKPPSSGVTWTPKGGSGAGNISDVTVDSLKAVATYVGTKGYDPGVFDNFPTFKNENHKILAKIDWNISKVHKLTLKFSDFKGTQDFLPSQSGGINGANSSGFVTYGPKFSKSSMGFSGITYIQEDVVRSGALELNSNFNSRFSNQFLATITKITSFKDHPGIQFPFVDIINSPGGAAQNGISVGNEPFNGNNNKVLNDVITVTDNFTYFAGKHTLTAGASYEYQKVGNMFMAGSQGYYVYRNVADFVNNRAPLLFSLTYSLDKDQDAVYSANLKIGQLAAYVQDEINVNPNFKVTAGIRIDKPIYLEDPKENPAITALTGLTDIAGKATSYTTGKWPQAKVLLSPRVGFRWDVEGDKSLILRGGSGIYTGRIPFVYLTNVPSGSGMYVFGTLITPNTVGANLNNFLFNPDRHAYNPFYNTTLPANLFPTSAGKTAPGTFAVTSRDFKFPQIWRTNFGIDKQLARTWKLSVELMYTKDLNSVYMFNANQKNADTVVRTGSVIRQRYSSNAASVRRLNTAVTNAIVLDNSNRGNSFVFTVQVSKTFAKGLYGTVAYNYNFAQDLTANPGSQAASVWSANPTSGTQNTLELAYSNFAVPHRIVGTISYRIEYLKHLATTLSFFYEGKSPGTYSYVYNGDLNQDGNSTTDLMYVPKNAKDPNEIQFQASFLYPNGVSYTGAQMAELFDNYINQDPYLRKHRGQVVQRNGAKLPWYNRLDMKVAQDVFTNIGKMRHTLQVTADVYNVLNLVNHDWGVRKISTVTNPLQLNTVVNGIPNFRLSAFNGAPVVASFQDNISTSTTYAIQLGVRYLF